MKLKNIIIFFPNFSKGGIEKTSLLLSNFLEKKKILIKFITFDKVDNNKFNFSKNIKFYHSKKKNNFFLLRNIYCVYILIQNLFNHSKKDTIIFSLQNNIFSIIVSKVLGFKVVARNSAPIDYFLRKDIFLNKLKLFLKMKIYFYSDLIISNSKSGANKIKNRLKNKKEIISIPNPVIKIEKKMNKVLKKNKILYVGRLSSEKGIFELVEGFELFNKDFSNFKLDIVGDGNQIKKLSKLIKDKNLNKCIKIIKWTNNINKHYKTSNILILPSFFEGFGNVLIEALNFNLPCVATNNDGPREILANGKYGFLMKDNRAQTINLSLRYVVKNYNHYKLKAINGYKNIQNYHIDKIGKKYFLKLNSILK